MGRKKVMCACGCGELMSPVDSRLRPRRYIHGHNRRSPKSESKLFRVRCSCGCGQLTNRWSPEGTEDSRKNYIKGHHRRGKSNHWLVKEKVKKRTSHERANKKKTHVTSCELQHIGGCKGILDVAHIDGDWFNNNDDNLIKLCRSHHRLVDSGRIDLADPKMPSFTVDKSGKRRYDR